MSELVLPRVIGHRGAAGHAPENTLEGIRKAAQLGAGWVEFDAKLTGDGVVILMHDDTLDRTTDGTGAVAKATYSDIARLDAGRWFAPEWQGIRVPRLANALDLLCKLDLAANVEIKPCHGRDIETAQAVVSILRGRWPPSRPWPLLSSFSHESLAAAAAAAPEMPRGLLVWEHPDDWSDSARALGCVSIHCADQHLTSGWAGQIRRAGYGLAVYTVNDRRRAEELRTWGVQCIITDSLDVMAGLV